MKKRNPLAVFVFGFITLGFYSWYWEVTTKGEMNKRGEHVPTAWIWLIPVVGYIWWAWKYSEATGHITKDKAPAILVFLLFMFTGMIGDAIVQHYFNEVDAETGPVIASVPAAADAAPETPVQSTPPTTPETPVIPPSSPTPEPPANPEPTPPAPEVPPSTDSQPPTPPSPTVSG